MNGSQILFADKCSIFFFFFPQMECVANVEKLGHCTCGSEFSDLLKNYWIWHHWPLISWSHQLAVQDGLPPNSLWGPPAPTVLQSPAHAPSPNLPPLIMWGIQWAPTKHQALCKSLEIGKYNTAPTLEELANQVYSGELQRCQLSAEQKKAKTRCSTGTLPEKLAGGPPKVTELGFEGWMWVIQAGGWRGILQLWGWNGEHLHGLLSICLLHRGTSQASNCLSPVRCQVGGCPDWCWSVYNPLPRPSYTFLLSKHQRSFTSTGKNLPD